MTDRAPTAKDLETLRNGLDALTKRYETFVADLNKALQGAKKNDDRIEAKVDALEKKLAEALKVIAARGR